MSPRFQGIATWMGATRWCAEKRREDALRRLGYRVVRLTWWADLREPSRMLALLGL